ncbi:MAG: hypothetical protein ACREJG_01720 [Candidatus Rokuibacteriota bacterium]
MIHAIVVLVAALVGAWVIAHLLYLGPVETAVDVTLTWVLGVTAASAIVAALSALGFGLVAGGANPAWLRFVQTARTGAAVIGGGLVLVGLLHYRDTEPRGEIHWIVLGFVVLAGAFAVHGWVTRERKKLT